MNSMNSASRSTSESSAMMCCRACGVNAGKMNAYQLPPNMAAQWLRTAAVSYPAKFRPAMVQFISYRERYYPAPRAVEYFAHSVIPF